MKLVLLEKLPLVVSRIFTSGILRHQPAANTQNYLFSGNCDIYHSIYSTIQYQIASHRLGCADREMKAASARKLKDCGVLSVVGGLQSQMIEVIGRGPMCGPERTALIGHKRAVSVRCRLHMRARRFLLRQCSQAWLGCVDLSSPSRHSRLSRDNTDIDLAGAPPPGGGGHRSSAARERIDRADHPARPLSSAPTAGGTGRPETQMRPATSKTQNISPRVRTEECSPCRPILR